MTEIKILHPIVNVFLTGNCGLSGCLTPKGLFFFNPFLLNQQQRLSKETVSLMFSR